MDRHDGEDLFDGPAVRQALKDGEITEVSGGEHGVQIGKIFRDVFHFGDKVVYLSTDGPKEVLRLYALLHRDVAEAEEILGLVESLLSVMEALE